MTQKHNCEDCEKDRQRDVDWNGPVVDEYAGKSTIPGVSAWAAEGKRLGYWGYFEEQVSKDYRWKHEQLVAEMRNDCENEKKAERAKLLEELEEQGNNILASSSRPMSDFLKLIRSKKS
jgi:hypothetical protein